MTISNTLAKTVSALGNGSNVNFTISFAFQANTQLEVYLQDESVQPYTRTKIDYGAGATKYTVSGGDPATTVVMGTAPTASQRIIILRVSTLTQEVDYDSTRAFPFGDHEAQMDKVIQLIQEEDLKVDSKIGLAETSTTTTPVFPEPVEDGVIKWNHASNALEAVSTDDLEVLAENVVFTPAGGVAAMDVQSAIVELDSELRPHLTDFANPHVVTSLQVGKDTAQWNADRIMGKEVDDSNIGDDRILAYDLGIDKLHYVPFEPEVPFTAKGDLLTSDGTDNVVLPVGTDGQVLVADSAELNGIKWSTAPAAVSDFIDLGDVPSAYASGDAGKAVTVNSTEDGLEFTTIAGYTSPLTTKGDINAFSTVDDRLGVGTNGQVLSADSTEATGLKWITTTDPIVAPSTGIVSGFAITDNLDGSVSVTGGTVRLYTNLDRTGNTVLYTVAALPSTALTDHVTNYIIVDYTLGTPAMRVTTNVLEINESTIIPIYTVVRTGTVLHIIHWDKLALGLADKIHYSIVKTDRYRRESGLALSEFGTRNIALTGGTVWIGAVDHILDAIDTTVSSYIFVYNVSGVWTSSFVGNSSYNNTQYDNGTDLATLSNGRYAINWCYRGVESQKHLYVVLGSGNYSLTQAQAAQPPANVPSIISSHAVLVGRIIVQKSAATATQIDSAFNVTFSQSPTTSHADLSDLQGGTAGEYYHLTNTEAGKLANIDFRATNNTFAGLNSGGATTCTYNTGYGYNTLNVNTGGSNTAIGAGAMDVNTTGVRNVALGRDSLGSATTASYNTGTGFYSGRSLVDGTYNTFVGYNAGSNASQKTDATNSTAVGNGAYTTKDNQVVIGNDSVTETVLSGDVLLTANKKLTLFDSTGAYKTELSAGTLAADVSFTFPAVAPTAGQVLLYDGGDCTIKWGNGSGIPFTTKGDLVTTTNGTDAAVLPLSSSVNGYVLQVDSTAANGFKWGANTASSSGYTLAAKTADYSIQTNEVTNNYIFTNTGASGLITLTLPTPTAGNCVVIVNKAGQQLNINSGDNAVFIKHPSYTSYDYKEIYSTAAESLVVLYATSTTSWNIINETAWSLGSPRGVFGGGAAEAASNTIDYITIATTGNATDFGDLTVARSGVAGCSSSTRGVFSGGIANIEPENIIDYITIASTGNATDFGDLTVARDGPTGCSSSTRGVFAGGISGSTFLNEIDYITIATTGSATDFGDLTVVRWGSGGCSSTTRGVFAGGGATTEATSNTIDYITIATTGNATDFGDLTVTRSGVAGCSSSTRGVFSGGYTLSIEAPYITSQNIIDYITIASTGNATDFGDLTVARNGSAGCSSSTRGIFGGGCVGFAGTVQNVIDYITIASTGNATDFGDLTVARGYLAGLSNAHGGI